MRVAIAGAGLMGGWHAHYARQCGASVCGVADPNHAERELKRRFRGAAVFSNVQSLLVELKPDVLHVCTPAATHEAIIEMALDAGVHLIVEKPLSTTAKITERLIGRAAERGLLITPVHQFVFQEGVIRTAASLARIGVPLHFDALFCSAGGNNVLNDELDEIAEDILPHPLSLLEMLFPCLLNEIEWTCLRSAHGEWRVIGIARKMFVSFLVSLHGRPTEASVRLTGTEGSIYLDLFHGFSVIHPGKVSRTRKITHPFTVASRTLWSAGLNLTRRVFKGEPAYPGLRRLIGCFYQAIQEDSKVPLSADHVLAVAWGRDKLRAQARSNNDVDAK